MKHEITSMNTKKALSASLKKFMEQKKLSKISVSEIIADCGVNRKTFYYHFQDIYALIKWTLEQEAVEVLKNFDLLLNMEEAMIFVIDYVDNNRHILKCVYDAIGRDEMKRFFYTDFHDVILSLIDRFEEEKGVSIDKNLKSYMITFYGEAIAGVLIDYFQDREKRSREEVIKYTTFILKKTISCIIDCTDEEKEILEKN